MATLLLQRDLKTKEQILDFFNPNIADLIDPFLLLNMKAAADRLEEAIKKKQKVLLYGDYDVDGTTAVTLMYRFLCPLIEDLHYYIPNRYEEGYGVSAKAMNWAVEEKFDLIVTLDCGVRNVQTLQIASSANIEIIVCDHHEPGDELPKAIVLDPKQKDCNYPFKELCGCGVGFKLLHALIKNGVGEEEELFALLDLLAIAIGADLVDVRGENRILATYGLKQLNEKMRPCFQTMLRIAKKELPLSLTDVVFTIAPRINAAGRMGTGMDAVKLMLSDSSMELEEAAMKIEKHNRERRLLDEQITIEAKEMLKEEEEEKFTTVVASDNWSKGVVGIVASRLIDQYYRPTVVLAKEGDMYTGSARTVGDFDIYQSLLECDDLFEKFGGHQHAAGLSLPENQLSAFKLRFENVVREKIGEHERIPNEEISLELSFSELQSENLRYGTIPRLKRMIDKMEPFGPGNMKPQFVTRNLVAQDIKLLKEKHLRFTAVDPDLNAGFQSIGFFMENLKEHVEGGLLFDMVYTIEINRWKDTERLQLNIKDIQPSAC